MSHSAAPRFAPGGDPIGNRPVGGGFVVPDPVRIVDGRYHLRMDGVDVPLHHGGPVRSFLPGWRATSLFTGFAPVYLLEFRSDAGTSGAWFLDHRLHHLGDEASQLPADLGELLRMRAGMVVREIVESVIGDGGKPLSAVAQGFLALQDATKVGIGGFAIDRVIAQPATTVVEHLGEQGIVGVCTSRGVPVSLPNRHLRAGFEPEWQDRIVAALRSGVLRWPSPVDGMPLDCEGSIVFDDFHFAYKFVDRRHGLPFVIVVAEHRSGAGGIWLPFEGILVGDLGPYSGSGRWVAQQHARHWVVSHALTRHGQLTGYFAAAKTGFRNILRIDSRHIGHQLWNELTGIESLQRQGLEGAITHVAAGPAGSVEIYGPIDRIFPRIEGHVDRSAVGHHAMIDQVYRTATIACRVTGDHVPAALRDRIGRHALQHAGRIARDDPDAGRDGIVIGLRVENRTMVDQEGFYRGLVAMIDRRFPSTAVIFDGHNASDADGGAAPISSHGEHMAAQAPHDVERRLVQAMRDAFPHRRDRILDTIMRPVPVSLAAAIRSRCFVSVWGASLAKYRWIANKPGFVLSNAWNLRHRPDLHIYDSPRYMEDPAPLEFLDPVLVRDDPDAEQVVPVIRGNEGFANFHLDTDGALAAIEAFLERHLSPR